MNRKPIQIDVEYFEKIQDCEQHELKGLTMGQKVCKLFDWFAVNSEALKSSDGVNTLQEEHEKLTENYNNLLSDLKAVKKRKEFWKSSYEKFNEMDPKSLKVQEELKLEKDKFEFDKQHKEKILDFNKRSKVLDAVTRERVEGYKTLRQNPGGISKDAINKLEEKIFFENPCKEAFPELEKKALKERVD